MPSRIRPPACTIARLPLATRKASSTRTAPRLTQLASALALIVMTGGLAGVPAQSHAQVQGAWFAQGNSQQFQQHSQAARQHAARAAHQGPNTAQQQIAARAQLAQSLDNLNRTAHAIAAQQAAQNAARLAAMQQAINVADGLAQGGLEVATGDKALWKGASAPVASSKDGHHTVAIAQTEPKAILNWNRFDVGRHTTVEFQQKSSDAVLNRVVGDQVAPSQIQGAIKGDGTVMVVNQNGVVFSGSSQVNVRNLVAAATDVDVEHFRTHGLYDKDSSRLFKNAAGKVLVERGAQINTHRSAASTQDGGYVLLLGSEVRNAGQIATPNGQTVLAAGDSFYIRKGVGTNGNVNSTTAGNEVSTGRKAGSTAGQVANTGLMTASTGDITLTGHEVLQAGVAVATTSQAKRGTIHLSTRTSDVDASVTLGKDSTTAILLEASDTTALDNQRDAALKRLDGTTVTNDATGVYDNLSTVTDRRDLSRVEIVSGNTVHFQGDSITLATGGEIVVSARHRTLVDAAARLDVSGALGVQVAMQANNLAINIQGNEQRDAPVNRDSKNLNNQDIWLDRRTLVHVPAGTNGYEGERWYTRGGLLEVSGWLATSGHSVGEWMAQGGSITVTGKDLVTRAGSQINLSGGTLDVQSGYMKQSWMRGADGRLYTVDNAPGDLLYKGLYQGYEQTSERWGQTRTFYNPLLAPRRRFEDGYTVGRDAGKLVVATSNALLEGDTLSEVYQGARQTRAAQAGLDGYYQSQSAVARRGQLIIGQYTPIYDAKNGLLRHALAPVLDRVKLAKVDGSIADGLQLNDAVNEARQGRLVLDTGLLNDAGLSAVRIAAKETIAVQNALHVTPGGEIVLYAPAVDVTANLKANSGVIRLGNVLLQPYAGAVAAGLLRDEGIIAPKHVDAGVRVREGAILDATGLVTDLRSEGAGRNSALAYLDGGTISIRSTDSVTLEKGALIDVSSGAAVRVEGDVVGGKGGNVQLGSGLVSTKAGNPASVLALDGDIRGHGVHGGGTLKIESASAISVGGKLLQADGLLQAGESVPINLILAENYKVRAGELLPADYKYLSTLAKPGEKVGAQPDLNGVTLAADWTLPYSTGISPTLDSYVVSYMLPGETTVRMLRVPPAKWGGEYILPAGAVITTIWTNNYFPTNYIVPGEVFPNGLQTVPYLKTALAGSTLSFDATLHAGAVIKPGGMVARSAKVERTTLLATALFQSGFARYDVRSHNGLLVADGVALQVLQPVLQADPAVLFAANGLAGLLQAWQPDLYQANYKNRQINQRHGASLSLAAGVAGSLTADDGLSEDVGDGGNLHVAQGASILLDPLQSIELSSRGSLTVDGLLQAKGGSIILLGPRTSLTSKNFSEGASLGDGLPNQRAITLGEHAVLDASAASYITHDLLGRAYGRLTPGGSIVIGGTLQESGSRALASDAFVVIKQGALVDASGRAALLDMDGTGARVVASDGGSISIASTSGLYLDGRLRSEAGRAGASGGRLTVALEAPNYLKSAADDAVLALRELQLVQGRQAGAEPGGMMYGHAVLAADQVRDGGFDSLRLYSNGLLSFAEDVNLALGREIRLYSGALAVADGVDPSITVSLSSPYVLLAGITDNGASADAYIRPSYQGGVSRLDTRATLTATANLLDIKGIVTSGLNNTVVSNTVERAGFAQLNLVSSGDIRFVDAEPIMNGGFAAYATELHSSGDILLRAAQIYPASGVGARVLAGRATASSFDPEALLVIERYDAHAEAPALPYSVFGRLTLGAATVVQNGVVRAPLGDLTLGTESSEGSTSVVTLGAGGLTSVSATGLVFPYGGTADGVIWTYEGKKVSLKGVGYEPSITLSATHVIVEKSATLDFSGGGDLLGAGFVSGRGGSTDARYNALVQVKANGFTLPGLGTNPVYAIVPGYASAYAPADSSGAVDPLIGQQITIAAGDIAGLAAGTYTLLPSTYALLPGAFRVEINGGGVGVAASASAVAMRNGSYALNGMLGTANTDIRSNLSSQVIITPADVLRSYSQYSETSYAEFVATQAKLNGTVRALLPADAGTLAIRLPSSSKSSLSFQGLTDFTPDEKGHGGTLTLTSSGVTTGYGAIEILSGGASPTDGFDGASVYAADLNAIGASRMTIGGVLYSNYSKSSDGANLSNYLQVSTTEGTGSIVLREGAILHAGEVFLIASNLSDGITIETGAGINTIGMGKVAYDSTDGYVYEPGDRAIVAVSNGWIDMLAPVADTGTRYSGAGPITIGTCGSTCTGTTQLYSEGTIAAATLADFELYEAVRYGTRNLVLAVGAVNAGSNAELAAAAARGALTSGVALNQSLLDRLLRGDTAYGAPALERLVLTAGESFNFFGNVSLDTTDPTTGKYRLDNLVLSTPAIYGYGQAGDVALVKAAKLTWAGLEGDALAPVLGGRGTGKGRLTVQADVIEFGYDTSARPTGIDDHTRTILGFANVLFEASNRITANKKGALSVYQSQAVGADGALLVGKGGAPVYQGGDLSLRAPLITGQGGSVNRITAGGTLHLLAPEAGGGRTESATPDQNLQTGAELNLAASTIVIDTTVALPSGKLTATADKDITLAEGAWLDLSGRAIQMFDVTRYSWGGDLVLRSTAGNIYQRAGATIDVSAKHNHAGLITATALGESAGIVDLLGTLLGSASGHYDAGGTYVPYRAGGVNLSAQALGTRGPLTQQFAQLNTRLNEGGFLGERSFHLKGKSDLTIGDELKASDINVSLDRGHLTVAGAIDASGERVGSIRLAAGRGLTLASGAVLDAHGKVLRVDSYGQIIDSPNRAVVELDAGTGRLVLAEGARIDLRHGTQSDGGGGKHRGTLDLYAARVGSGGSAQDADAATYGDIAIDASGNVTVQGAKSIAVYGRKVYDDARYNDASKGETSASGRPYQIIDQAYLNTKHDQAVTFMHAALGNNDLLNLRLAGLNNETYRNAFHLRPAVEIVSATPDGDLIVSGDLDLSGYRYASLNPHTQKSTVYGSGEVGQLTMRAGGDLSIYGSINDGFAPPPETPDDKGWLLTPGVQAFGGDVVVPVPGVTLAEGTKYPKGKTLNYDITARNVTLPAGTTLPQAITLEGALTLPPGTVLAADVVATDGTVFPAGMVVGTDGLALTSGAQLKPGTRLPVAMTVASLIWPAGVALPVEMTQQGSKTLPVGALIVSGTDVVLPEDAISIDLRPKDAAGNYIARSNWAVAQMLPAGSQSWSMRLVAGADTEASDRRLIRQDGGNIVLTDTHYISEKKMGASGVWYWSDDNGWGGEPGKPVDDWALDPDYNLCEIDPGQCIKVSWIWADDNAWGGEPGKPVDKWALDPDYNLCEIEPGQCVAIGGSGALVAVIPKSPIFSVVRTGTGDLDIATAGDLAMHSPYGVYTAGTQTSLGSQELDAAYNQGRTGWGTDGTVLDGRAGSQVAEYEALVSGADRLYRAWYPDGGGNLTVSAGGDLTGDSWSSSLDYGSGSASVGNWLWRQGTGSTGNVEDVPTAWWINFGTYTYDFAEANQDKPGGHWPIMTGFTGLGTLGGGKATVRVGGDAGVTKVRSTNAAETGRLSRSEGLVLAVGGTGRVLADGRLVLTGGGDLDLRIGGGWNSHADARLQSSGDTTAQTHELYGALVNLRGPITMEAGQVGVIELIYGLNLSANQDAKEVRATDPYTSSLSLATGGLMLVAGDSTATIASRGDMVLGGIADAGLVDLDNYVAYRGDAGSGEVGETWFSLWTDRTALDLLSAGGDMAFVTLPSETLAGYHNLRWDYMSNGGWFLLPGNVRAAAARGSIFYGTSAAYLNTRGSATNWETGGLLLAPLGEGTIELLAGDSIYAGGYSISSSGADASSIATVFNPAFVGHSSSGHPLVSNVSDDAPTAGFGYNPLFAFGVNSIGHAVGVSEEQTSPSRFYAVDGDIVGLRSGTVVAFGNYVLRANQTDYVAKGPVAIRAGADIVNIGGLSSASGFTKDFYTSTLSGNLIVHTNPNDVSVIEAGRNIIYANFDIAGPGTLEMSAGGNIMQKDLASLTSIGSVVVGDSRPGASIVVQAGATASNTNYAGFLSQYLDSAHLADLDRPLADQSGKVAKTYQNELVEWLAERYGFEGAPEGALPYFSGLAPEQQRIFARQVYFAELRAGGREYNDAEGPRRGSYLRGRNAIATLFPEKNAAGQAIGYQGDLLIYGDAGIHTNLGGDVHVLTPGGSQTYGVEGVSPGGTAGVITRGEGDIHMYSLGSILLGQSRIMTAAGGDILGWSALGDINAGRGSKTTLVYAPPRRVYDVFGNVSVTPDVPATGAGIATLNRGDVDLIAPLGTIDAGEAGIRVSGNVNIAALHVVNAENIEVQGESKGIPVVAAVNVGALTSASSAASSAATAAQETIARARSEARSSQPSQIQVQVLGFGSDLSQHSPAGQGGGGQAGLPAKGHAAYQAAGPVRIVGLGASPQSALAQLTAQEKSRMGD